MTKIQNKSKTYLIRLPLICNFNCRFCFLEKKEGQILNFFWGDILRQIDDAKKTNSDKITFSGGEPTLIKELPLLISYAKDTGIKEVEIQTNALKCSYESYTKELKNAGLDSVLIGFHSHKEKIFDFLTRTNGYFPKVLEGIKNLFKYKIRVSFNHTITALTFKDLEDYVRFLFSNFPKPKSIFLTLVYPCGQCWQHKNLIPRASQVAPYFLKTWEYCQKNEVPVFTPHCGMPGFPLCLLESNGRADLEKLISSGRKNIRTEEFDCVNLKPASCQKCRYNRACVGIALNYKKLYGLKEFQLIQ